MSVKTTGCGDHDSANVLQEVRWSDEMRKIVGRNGWLEPEEIARIGRNLYTRHATAGVHAHYDNYYGSLDMCLHDLIYL